MSNPSITADKTPWYQWDTGLTVTVSGGEMNECHFANRKQGTAYVQAVINGIARVPDELLQVAAPIKAYGYVSDSAGGQTYIEQTFEVVARNIPADYTYTKTAQKTVRDAEAARDEAVQAAKDAKASELAADDSAVEASNSAQSAGESASAAATSASNAANSADDAAKSASDAKAAADKAVEDASAQLKTYTDNAKTSADNAATSASNAADAASAASGSASAAEQRATDASNAKVAAQTAKDGAEAAKAEAATSASNAASSATAAAQSASDAAASVGEMLTEAKKYTDANTSNALVGTVSGKLLHVEDAWPSPAREFVVYGKSVQDGTPTPDAPVPIESVGELIVESTGKNLLDYQSWKEHIKNDGVTHGTFEFGNDGSIAITATDYDAYTNHSVAQFPSIGVRPGQTYTLSWSADNNNSGLIYVFFNGVDLNNAYESNTNSKKLTFTIPSDCNFITFRFGVLNVGDTIKYSNIQIELGSTATDYSPYVAGSTPNLLVSEDGTAYELRSLPDGTMDKLVVKDARRILDKTLNKIVVDGITHLCIAVLNGNQAIINVGTAPEKDNEGKAKVICDKLPTVSANDTYNGVKQGIASCAAGAYNSNPGGTINIHIDGISTVEDMNEWLQKNPLTVIYELYENEKETIDLGQADPILIPETISNVLVEASITPECTMTYKRDINVAFDNIVQAVVAAAAGE